MKGNVIGFDPDTNTGAISGYDGNRYDFVTLDWRAPGRPRSGDVVDFQAVDRRATEIYLLEPQYVAPNFAEFYFSPSGRISRSQYWLRFVLPYAAIVFVLEIISAIISAVLGKDSGAYVAANAIIMILYLIAFWPSIAILVKRMHDRNKSGWGILWLILPTMAFTIMLFAWLGAAILAATQGETVSFSGPQGVLGVLTIVLGLVVLGINIWFFVEFGCLRGTIGANRYGPDPVR